VAQKQKMKETPNAERPTANAELAEHTSAFSVGRSAFGVRRLVFRIVDLLIGGVFIYAGAIKILDPVQFAYDIDNYKILPWTVGVALAFYLPWVELLAGVALIFRRFYSGAVSILLALMAIFIAATIAAKARGLDITCGCFGHASQHWSFPAHMAVDLAIFAALVLLVFRSAHENRSPA
jgi:hypothetical protein